MPMGGTGELQDMTGSQSASGRQRISYTIWTESRPRYVYVTEDEVVNAISAFYDIVRHRRRRRGFRRFVVRSLAIVCD